jgi:hypothetical protein
MKKPASARAGKLRGWRKSFAPHSSLPDSPRLDSGLVRRRRRGTSALSKRARGGGGAAGARSAVCEDLDHRLMNQAVAGQYFWRVDTQGGGFEIGNHSPGLFN